MERAFRKLTLVPCPMPQPHQAVLFFVDQGSGGRWSTDRTGRGHEDAAMAAPMRKNRYAVEFHRML